MIEQLRAFDTSDLVEKELPPVISPPASAPGVMAAGSVPEGFGHLDTKQANADAWIAVTQPEEWSQADTDRLKEYLADLGPAE